MKRENIYLIIVLFVCCCIFLAATILSNKRNIEPATAVTLTTTTPTSATETIIYPAFETLVYIKFSTLEEISGYRIRISNYLEKLSNYTNSDLIIYEIQKMQELDILYLNDYISLTKQLEQEKRAQYMEEYPVATEIWIFLKEELGCSDAVCAGIIGNMMAEAGGQTLNIQPIIWDGTYEYYGICQWAIIYNPAVANTSLREQLIYLKNNIQTEMDMWGFLYAEDFNYEQFLNLTDPGEIALAFAKCYEKCHERHYEIRVIHAHTAYEYFTSDTRE